MSLPARLIVQSSYTPDTRIIKLKSFVTFRFHIETTELPVEIKGKLKMLILESCMLHVI
jgi:hypothetical protein